MNNVNWDATRFIFDVVQTVIMAAVGIYAWWTNRNHVTKSAIKAVEDKVELVEKNLSDEIHELDSRTGGIEKSIELMPRHEDLAGIHEKVNEAVGEMAKVSGRLDTLIPTLQLIQQHLLNSGGKK